MDDQAKHDLRWVGVWFAATVTFAVIGASWRNAWWMGALVTGTFLAIHGIACFNEWRDRRALAIRDRKPPDSV